jgi:hypothetical protein
MFILGLTKTGVDVSGEEALAMSTAHHVCEVTEAAATSPEGVTTVGALLGLSTDQSVSFVAYARLHCTDLP